MRRIFTFLGLMSKRGDQSNPMKLEPDVTVEPHAVVLDTQVPATRRLRLECKDDKKFRLNKLLMGAYDQAHRTCAPGDLAALVVHQGRGRHFWILDEEDAVDLHLFCQLKRLLADRGYADFRSYARAVREYAITANDTAGSDGDLEPADVGGESEVA